LSVSEEAPVPTSSSVFFLCSHSSLFFFIMNPPPPRSTLFPYTTLFRSCPTPIDGPPMTSSDMPGLTRRLRALAADAPGPTGAVRSEEHTSELQSRENLVCRLLLEKKKKKANTHDAWSSFFVSW